MLTIADFTARFRDRKPHLTRQYHFKAWQTTKTLNAKEVMTISEKLFILRGKRGLENRNWYGKNRFDSMMIYGKVD